MKKMYAARGPNIALRDVGEGIPKEVTFELRSEGCIGNKQRGRGKVVQTRHITREIPEARKPLYWRKLQMAVVKPGRQGSSDEDRGMQGPDHRASWAGSRMKMKLGSCSG